MSLSDKLKHIKPLADLEQPSYEDSLFEEIRRNEKLIIAPFPSNLLDDTYKPDYKGIKVTYNRESDEYNVKLLSIDSYSPNHKRINQRIALSTIKYFSKLYLNSIEHYATKVMSFVDNNQASTYVVSRDEQGEATISIFKDKDSVEKSYWIEYNKANQAALLGHGFEGREHVKDVIVEIVAKELITFRAMIEPEGKRRPSRLFN